MTRQTKKIILPFTKKEVEVITYFTRGEKQEIAKATFGEGKISANTQEIEGKNLFNSPNKMLELFCTNLSIDEILNLPEEDCEFLDEEANNLSTVKKK